MKLNMKLAGPRVLLKVKKTEEKTSGGIILTEKHREDETCSQTEGEVILLGSTAYKRKDSYCNGESWCDIGDTVYFSKYGASRILNKYLPSDEHEYWILMDKDVMLVKSEHEDKENVRAN